MSGMSLNRAKTMFGGMAQAAVHAGREDLQDGRYAVLMQKVENKESRKCVPFTAFSGTVLWPICDGMGRLPDSDMFEGSPAGSEADWANFMSDYFASNIKTFIVTCLGMTSEDLKSQQKGMSNAEIEDEFFGYCLAMTGSEVQGEDIVRVGPGVFDGTTVIEVQVRRSEVIPTDDGKPPKKPFVNINPKAKIPLTEVATKMAEDEIAIYFGSFENFAKLVEDEEALAAM